MLAVSRRLAPLLTALSIGLGLMAAPLVAQAQDYSELRVNTSEPKQTAIVIDARTGEVLFAKRADSPRYPASVKTVTEGMHYMKINGREVYKFAVTRMQELIQEAMSDCRLTVGDIALVIPHQVNQRIIDSAVRHLNFPPEKVMGNLERYGNTSAASVPIALDEAMRTGRLRRGDTVLLVAFGGGFTWASAVFTL